jgi:hypothetical protein
MLTPLQCDTFVRCIDARDWAQLENAFRPFSLLSIISIEPSPQSSAPILVYIVDSLWPTTAIHDPETHVTAI